MQGRPLKAPVIAEVYARMADARSDEAHQDFVVPRTFHIEELDLQEAALPAQNGRPNLACRPLGMPSQCPTPFIFAPSHFSSLKPCDPREALLSAGTLR
jgi:hypothetical protein